MDQAEYPYHEKGFVPKVDPEGKLIIKYEKCPKSYKLGSGKVNYNGVELAGNIEVGVNEENLNRKMFKSMDELIEELDSVVERKRKEHQINTLALLLPWAFTEQKSVGEMDEFLKESLGRVENGSE